jgi:hypothetical protein
MGSRSIKGKFFHVRKGNISARGKFETMWITPDVSSYIPATIEVPKVAPLNSSDAVSPIAPKATERTDQQQPSQFYDVHQDADRILTGVGEISQIPIGMGGSGLS